MRITRDSILLLLAAAALGLLIALPAGPAGEVAEGTRILAGVLLPTVVATLLLVRAGHRFSASGRAATRERLRLAQIMRRVPAAISVQDSDGVFVTVNPAVVSHYGAATAEQIVGHRPRRGSLHEVDHAFRQVLDWNEPVDLIRTSESRTGELSTFNSTLLPFELDDGRAGVLQIATDITEMRAVHERLQGVLTRALSDFIPMCAGCRQVRVEDVPSDADGDAEWAPLEAYVSSRTEARFSHTFCPSCEERLYGPEMRGSGGQSGGG